MGVRRSAFGVALMTLLVFAVVFGAASPSGAASPNVTFSLSCSPSMVSFDDEWGCSGTITNNGPQTVTQVTLFEQIDGAVLVSSSFEPGICTDLEDGGTSCDLVNLRDGDVIEFTTIFGPEDSWAGTLLNTAFVTFDERISDQDRGKQDTVCANTSAPPPCDDDDPDSRESAELIAEGDDDRAGGYVAFVEGEIDTLATSETLTPMSNVSTNAQVPYRLDEFPFGLGATIVERDRSSPGEGCGEGFTCFGQIVEELIAGEFPLDEPLVNEFRLIVPKGKNANNILVFHNGQGPGQSCLEAPLQETGDFCVQSVSQNSKTKVVTIVVLKTENGEWAFG